jgi:cell division protein FtsZ
MRPQVARFASEVEAEGSTAQRGDGAAAENSAREEYGSAYYEAARQQARQETAVAERQAESAALDRQEVAPREERAQEVYTPPVGVTPATDAEEEVELVAVAASVFDDDFFRRPNEELRAIGAKSWQGRDIAVVARVEDTSEESTAQRAGTNETGTKTPSLAGYAAESPAEADLDIPAFLRRSH